MNATIERTEKTVVPVKDRAEKFIADLLIQLEKGDVGQWVKTWSAFSKGKANGFCNAAHKNGYRGTNVLQVWLDCIKNGYTDTRYLTYKQIQEIARKHNRQGFLSGENCKKYINLYAVFPKIIKEIVDGKEQDKFVGMHWSMTPNMYNIELTDLADLFPIAETVTVERPLTEREQNAMDILSSKYLAPHKEENQDRAFYVPMMDKIVMPLRASFKSNGEFICTLAHEKAHSTGHKTRCNRDMTGEKGSTKYAKEELVAELCAFMFGSCFELEWEQNSSNYIKGWLLKAKETPAATMFSALGQSEKAFYYIMNGQNMQAAQPSE